MLFSRSRFLDYCIVLSCGDGDNDLIVIVSFSMYSAILDWSLSRRPHCYLMVDTVEYGIIIGRMSMKGAREYSILIVLAATSTIEVVSLSFATSIVADLVEGFACTT